MAAAATDVKDVYEADAFSSDLWHFTKTEQQISNDKKQKTHEKITGEAKDFDPADKAIILVDNIFLNCRKHNARIVGAVLPGLAH